MVSKRKRHDGANDTPQSSASTASAAALSFETLPPDIFAAIVAKYSEPSDVSAVTQCSKATRDACRSDPIRESVRNTMVSIGAGRILDRLEDVEEEEDDEEVEEDPCSDFRVLVAAEAIFWDADGVLGKSRSFGWDDALRKARDLLSLKDFKPEMLDKGHWRYEENAGPENCQRLYSPHGGVTLCFGFLVPHEEFIDQMHVGRRWYGASDRHASSLALSRDKRRILWSQSLAETPYEGEDRYSELHNTEDIRKFWSGDEKEKSPLAIKRQGEVYPVSLHMTGSGSEAPCESDRRPPGLKAWRGPHIGFHRDAALHDLNKRAGLPKIGLDCYEESPGEDPLTGELITYDSSVGIHFCGGQNYYSFGEEAVIGIKLGVPVPAPAFDIFHATGIRFFGQIEGLAPEFGSDIDIPSDQFVASLAGWETPASFQFRAFEEGLKCRMLKVVRQIPKYESIGPKDLHFYLVSNELR